MKKISNDNIFLIEDHHQALGIWRKKRLKNLDLVHIDAHVDFGFFDIEEPQDIIREAKSLNELKSKLEKEILFRRYGFSKESLINIGNYIYPAMREGILKDFYWVIPGNLDEFNSSAKKIIKLLRVFAKLGPNSNGQIKIKNGIIISKLMGRRFIILTLEKLPILKQKTLLDIDTDFLVTPRLPDLDKLPKIGDLSPWIPTDKFTEILKRRIINPQVITIAYSVNGGFTPIKYKYLADNIAFCFSQDKFKRRFRRVCLSSKYFRLFQTTGKPAYYRKAVSLDPSYKVYDNNYGPIYLQRGRLLKAQWEFKKILKADSKNPYALTGLGEVALKKRDFIRAKRYFSYALRQKKDLASGLWGLARSEFGLKNFKESKKLLTNYKDQQPLQPQAYYLLGYVFEKERKFFESAKLFKDAIKLGLRDIEPLMHLSAIVCHLKEKDTTIDFLIKQFKEFKKAFIKTKRLNLKKLGGVKNLSRVEEKMRVLEKRLRSFH